LPAVYANVADGLPVEAAYTRSRRKHRQTRNPDSKEYANLV